MDSMFESDLNMKRANLEAMESLLKEDEIRLLFGECYEKIKKALSDYIEIPNHYKTIISLWIIGTYFHKDFETYPYLFFNAMKGSGKSRTLKLITFLSKNGQMLTSLTDAVLFRSSGTLGIDEFESVGSKEKQSLRELLNAGYKKGAKIKRLRKVQKRDKEITDKRIETHEIEEFDAYRPILMANIWGMDEVLADRCITLTLEKSSNPFFTKKVENFESVKEIAEIKLNLLKLQKKVSFNFASELYNKWNSFINEVYGEQDIADNTERKSIEKKSTLKEIEENELFLKINETSIDGRNLELFFPLFILAWKIDENVFSEILSIASKITSDKKTDEILESKDVMFLDFISRGFIYDGSWISLNKLTNDFKRFVGEEEEENKWINQKWVGRALKRLSLISSKRRVGSGREVIIDRARATEKVKIFY